MIAVGKKQSNLIYRMFLEVEKPDRHEVNVCMSSIKVWHERLAHLNVRALRELASADLIPEVTFEKDEFFCEPYQLGKSHKLPFKNKVSSSSAPGEFFHIDVCGPIPTESVSGARYYVLFKDDCTGFKYVHFLKHKADVADKFIELEKQVNNQFGRSMKILCTDNGREYVNDRMKKYLRERGIVHGCSAPYTPK